MSAVRIGMKIAPWGRTLAVFYLIVASLAFWPGDQASLMPSGDWSLQTLVVLAIGLWISALFACVAWTGCSPPVALTDPAVLWCWLRGTHPDRASPLEVERLRRLNLKAGVFTSGGEARRLIGLIEGRLPPTLQQQRELALYRPKHAVMTRISAERFLARRYVEEEWTEALAWSDAWAESGVDIQYPECSVRAEREAFDDAFAALDARGIRYPMPAVFSAYDIVSETARMQLALDMPHELQMIQQKFLRDGVTRRALAVGETWQMIAPLLDIWRREPEFEWADICLFLLARDRPAVLVDPWAASQLVAEMEAMLSQSDC